jgi:Protein of unknown function (DUF3109)
MSNKISLPMLNLDEARFECTFGRGCEGVCCKDGKPPLFRDEVERIDANIDRILPRMRPAAQKVARQKGYLDGRSEPDRPYVRTVENWCIFFNQGCVLHALGDEEGDLAKYKPRECIWFPLWHDKKGNWYVRQHGYEGETWDLGCLNPAITKTPAAETLQYEMKFVERWLAEKEAAASKAKGKR